VPSNAGAKAIRRASSIMAPEETYFDPTTATRVNGRPALHEHMRPFWGQISIDRFEMIARRCNTRVIQPC
jgi:hypothetical protein